MSNEEITPAELADDAVMVDVREQDEWDAGHAPGAIHIPLGELPSRLDDLPDIDPMPIVCRSGNRSARAAAWLEHQGFDAVNVAGGMKDWATASKPLAGTDSDPRVI
ncbi:rhodanese-like domain-containing protein [Leekyejoonella antrihumi]|uniref:Rhodanese-like domain-containing protein n=1 Tax=Leekyejoonella antrihumi TaxID=1660198 RepID=A0A563E6M0_9MICO|nr:rhodanese-like domain-containing protein [Leekyejoonella antrihumi]TWP37862.1 rhodanese-like domain-containing protein [Leekyejoonella antrihumi]